MKNLKIIVVLVWFTLLMCNIQAFADQNSFENLHLKKTNTCEEKGGICSFDVSPEGKIAVAQNNQTIYIYDPYGEFLYGYEFFTYGSYGVKWNGENLLLYFTRGNSMVEIDQSGQYVDEWYVTGADKDIFSASKIFQDTSYRMSSAVPFLDIVTNSYSRLVKTSPDGTELIIYDSGFSEVLRVFILFILGIGFFILVIGVLIRFLAKSTVPKPS